MTEIRDEKGRFVTSNGGIVQAGHYKALRQLQQGKPFDGQLQEIYLEKLDNLPLDINKLSPLDRDIQIGICRQDAVVELLWLAVLQSASLGQINQTVSRAKDYIKLSNTTTRLKLKARESLLQAESKIVDLDNLPKNVLGQISK